MRDDLGGKNVHSPLKVSYQKGHSKRLKGIQFLRRRKGWDSKIRLYHDIQIMPEDTQRGYNWLIPKFSWAINCKERCIFFTIYRFSKNYASILLKKLIL